MKTPETEAYREAIVGIATELVGSPTIRYVPGSPELGQSPISGFDCSGFVRFVLTESGLQVPDYIGQDGTIRQTRHTNEFWDHYGATVHQGLHKGGDIIFFSREGWTPSHVGVVRDEESYVHAPGHDGQKVEIQPIEFEAIIPRPRDGHRILFTSNPVGFKAPVVMHENASYRVHQRVI